jgi:hypothetical protein
VTPVEPARPLLGEQGWQWLVDKELSLLPSPARPSWLRWAWVALAVVLVGLAVLVVLIGARL